MIELKIQGKTFRYFSSVSINTRLDSIASSFDFSGFLDYTSAEAIELFRPLKYQDCDIWFVDESRNIREKLITGRIVNTAYSVKQVQELVKIKGFSIPGIFERINLPPRLYPLQFDGLSLEQIARKICDAFNIELKILPSANANAVKAFTEVKISPSQNYKGLSFANG